MVTNMLANVICCEFEKSVGKWKHEKGEALHIGFGMMTGAGTDQYRVVHMYIHAPANYVYVAIQEERIDEDGKRHVGPMEILSYHDSCWRDAVSQFIFKNRLDLSVFNSFKRHLQGDWFDVVNLSAAEVMYLRDADKWRQDSWKTDATVCPIPNPFDNRGIWAGKC